MIAEPYQTQISKLPLSLQAVYRALQSRFGSRIRLHESLARFAASRVGGAADLFVEVNSLEELSIAVAEAWQSSANLTILGGGSNVLVSDAGVRGLVILNRARAIRFDETEPNPSVWVESGANLGLVARQAATHGWAGLEWAAGIPGTVGGAIVGNAGAQGCDIAGNLLVAEILQRKMKADGVEIEKQVWPVERFEYRYRGSVIKRNPGQQVVLAGRLKLVKSSVEEVRTKMETFSAYRRKTQPPGASMGSMFKNPPGDYAGRLIEAAGLKGTRIGDAQISPLHANFFLNLGNARAEEIFALIQMAKDRVEQQFGVRMEPEIELIGDWKGYETPPKPRG